MDQPSFYLGKYRFLVAAIAAFFVLSVGVYSLNFLLLRQVENDAAKINEAGKLRGYSQQLAKAILTLAHESAAGEPIQTSRAQISEAHLALEQSLRTLRTLAAGEETAEELDARDRLEKQWVPLRDAAVVLLAPAYTAADLEAAVTSSNARNVRLLQLADDLTLRHEEVAAARARSMRRLQFGAIALALLDFLFIVVHAARSLRRSDREAERARRETDDILHTVREGLFLIDREGDVGTQRSAHLGKVFPHPLAPGDNFLATLATLVSAESMESARQYIGLLFNERAKPALLAELNPLQRVEVRQPGRGAATYLSFNFHPVRSAAGIRALLVSASDVSEAVRLERELADAEERARDEVALLLEVLDNDPAEVEEFLAGVKSKIERLNDALRDVPAETTAYGALVTRVFRDVHTIKGEAAALSLGSLVAQAHALEDVLDALRRRHDLGGEDLIGLATGLGQLMQALARVESVVSRIAAFARPSAPGTEPVAAEAGDRVLRSVERTQRLALAIAADLNKKLRVETSLAHVGEVPDIVHRLLREGLPQLVRNAVVHGIEGAEERLQAGKAEEGRLRIELRRAADASLELSVADDGRGIDVQRLRRQLIDAGHRDAQTVAAMSDRDVVAMLFDPRFSTAAAPTEHAGRGVGLDVLSVLARETGVRLKLASAPRAYTRFTLRWSPT